MSSLASCRNLSINKLNQNLHFGQKRNLPYEICRLFGAQFKCTTKRQGYVKMLLEMLLGQSQWEKFAHSFGSEFLACSGDALRPVLLGG
jgi:hypothetical protein